MKEQVKLFLSQGGYYGSGKQLNSMFAKVRYEKGWLWGVFFSFVKYAGLNSLLASCTIVSLLDLAVLNA